MEVRRGSMQVAGRLVVAALFRNLVVLEKGRRMDSPGPERGPLRGGRDV